MLSHRRRALLRSAFSMAVASQSALLPAVERRKSQQLYVTGARTVDKQYVGVLFDEGGTLVQTMGLPDRAHGAASHSASQRVVIFARRPGLYMSAFNLRSPENLQQIQAADQRHFYGHGVFSPSGDILYATENDFEQARGVLGVYDANRGYKRIGEIYTGGIGPHEVIGIPGTQWLAVANGGIQTHPQMGREKLNIDTMQASITLINSCNGDIVGRHVLSDEQHQLSLRHLVYAGNGEIWFAGQYEGTQPVVSSLAGYLSIEKTLRSYVQGLSDDGIEVLALPQSLQARTQNYLSSVAVCGDAVVYTSARGGVAFAINRHSHKLEEAVSVFDCSGVASAYVSNELNQDVEQNYQSIVTSGTGDIVQLSSQGVVNLANHRLQWDNHLYRV